MWPNLLLIVPVLTACGSTPQAAPPAIQPPTRVPSFAAEASPAEPPVKGDAATVEPGTAQVESAAPAATPRPKPVVSDEHPPIAWVAGEPISAEDFLVEWYRVAPREFNLILDKMVTTRLAFAEASRMGLRLTPEAIERRMAEERGRMQAALDAKGETRSIEEVIKAESGSSPEAYFAEMRQATFHNMIVGRMARAWSLATDTRGVRVLVVPAEELAGIQEALDGGADFAELAREKSIDGSAERGGWVPHVGNRKPSPLSVLAFETAVGEVGGPIELGEHRAFVRVEKERTALTGDWAAVGPRVEASLAMDPVEESEYLLWKLTMERRYPIDIRRLEELLSQ